MNEKPDISTLFSMLSNNEDFKNKNPEEILAKLMSSNSFNTSSSSDNQTYNSTNTSNDNSYSNDIPDMEIMMKFMRIMKSSNENNPSKDLLNSLKPFLNDSRKEKVDQYIKILGITKALETFNDLGDNLK